MATTTNQAIETAPAGTSGLIAEPWSKGEIYGVAANWSQASAPVFFFGPNGWESRQYQVADFQHRAKDALELELRETLIAGGDDEDDAEDLVDDATEF